MEWNGGWIKKIPLQKERKKETIEHYLAKSKKNKIVKCPSYMVDADTKYSLKSIMG